MASAKVHRYENIKLVLLDIEGTVCSISFVKDVLFPYALKALPEVLSQKWDDEEFATYRDAFPEEARASPDAIQEHVEDLTARDIKVAYLKNLQGYLWKTGYENGSYATPLFPDVHPKLSTWRHSGIKLVIFSSGSVAAQKLLFAHIQSDLGVTDMTPDISGWFDTVNAGSKTEKASYHKIAAEMGVETREVLFFSDNVREIRAAVEAGMEAVTVEREGNAPLTEGDREELTVVTSFDDVDVVVGGSEKEDAGADGEAEEHEVDAGEANGENGDAVERANGERETETEADKADVGEEAVTSKKRSAEEEPEVATKITKVGDGDVATNAAETEGDDATKTD